MSLINPNPQSKLKIFKSKTLPLLLRGMAFILVGISVSCSFPGFSPRFSLNPPPASTYTPAAPTATPQPLPPALAESDPLPGAWLALDNPITLYFNQPMQRSSVEKALSGESALISNISWSDDATLVLSPQEALPPDTEISLSINTDAQAANGQKLTQPIELKYRTTSALRLTQSLPEPDSVEVDPSSAIVASFNQPVIALGADPDELPVAFTVSSNNEAQVAGKGEWLNTSTYIYSPEPALQGGQRYSVALNPQIKSVSGSGLESAQGWSFSTAIPKLMSVSPENDSQAVGLDAPIVLKFNQAMNPQSVQAGFQLLDSHQQVVDGSFTWDEAGEVMTYTTSSLLNRSQTYTLLLAKEVESLGGAPLGANLESHFQTVPALTVTGSYPQVGHEKPVFEAALLYLSAPIQDEENIDKYISVTPELQDLRVWYSSTDLSISFSGSYQPETSYIVILSAKTMDLWGGRISSEYKLGFRTSAIPPTINSYPPSEIFLTPQDEGLSLMATNLPSVNLTRGSITLADFMTMMGVNGYDLRQSYTSPDQQSWQQNLDMPPNLSQWVTLAVSPDRTPLTPGLYFLRLDPGIEGASNTPYILTVSNVHLTFKISATDVLVWAIDLRNNSPVTGADIQIYDESQNILATGKTDQQGVFQGSIPEISNLYSTFFAVMGKPGNEAFGITLSNWDISTSGWDFGIDTSFQPPHLESYIYTDRPIYRPGQTVNFRAIIRQAYNGRYSLPDLSASQGQLPITIWDDMGQELSKVNLPVSGFGTAYGEYTLSSEAAPGYYRISCDLTAQNDVTFQVANYRKPEINLQVNFQEKQALAGSSLKADISAQYFFGAPAGNAPLHWALYAKNDTLVLPNFQVGVEDVSWLYAYDYPYYGDTGLGEMLTEGEAKTDPNGNLSLELPTEKSEQRQQLTLEVTITDESGLPVSARGTLTLNPALFYIGIHPDSWIGSANEQIGFDIQTVDWENKPSGPHSLKAVFQKVNWVKEDKTSETGEPVYTAQYTPVASVDFKTDSQGMAKLAFTPQEPGTFQLDISGEVAHTSIYIWVVGSGQSVWQDLPNQRIHLVADKDTYEPGDTARVFIPNPYPASSPALVTVERSIIIEQQISSIEPGGSTLEFPLSNEDAPNIFIAVTLIGTTSEDKPDYRQGYVELPVSAEQQQLDVSVIGQPEKAGPGDEVTFDIQVMDQSEKPVQGEFSFAVVDKAVLTLADPNSEDIFSAYYGSQPLGVRTGLGLAVYAQRHIIQLGGLGGGGGNEATSVTRENFPDTAFWAPDILTDGEGHAQVKVTLPDNLTTWQVDVRGLTKETLVGEAKTEIIASKPLLLRPATPRFFVRGDHVFISTVVQNNTSSELDASVAIQADGFSLDDPAQATQNVTIPAGGRASIAWWGTVQDVDSVNMTFKTQAGEYQDSIRVDNGAIPVLAYTSPQTFSTSGVLDQAVDRLEVVSIPRSVPKSSRQGELSIELSPSLAGVIGSALDVLEYYPYECTEQTVSRFLPNLETYLAFNEMRQKSPELEARLERTLKQGVNLLSTRQSVDGGWAWWQGGASDPYISAYVLFGLLRAQEAGFPVDQEKLQKATEYLLATLSTPSMLSEGWQLDRLAFEHYVLALAGVGNLAGAQEIYAVRDNLDPWAKAYLALTLEKLSPGSAQAETLISDLATAAIRSATGAHWEGKHPNYQNMQTTITTSAVVLYALADVQPKSPLVSEATRYLAAHRLDNGAWDSTYSTAWTIMALAQVMRKTGDLSGDFSYSALLNGSPFASGESNTQNWFSPVTGKLPLETLYWDDPNALIIRRSAGLGNLYYRANLKVYRLVETISALDQGIHFERAYYPSGDDSKRPSSPIHAVGKGEKVNVHLSLTLPQDVYYLVLEDHIPAGAEILDIRLKTSQLGGVPEVTSSAIGELYKKGWGWWYFNDPMIYDDHITWTLDYLPAGSYEIIYSLVTLQAGEFRVLPARAWEFYFPEVQGSSVGEIFTIEEK